MPIVTFAMPGVHRPKWLWRIGVEANLVLPSDVSALPGRVRLYAFQKGICDAISSPEITRVSVS